MQLFQDEILRISINYANPNRSDMVSDGKIAAEMSLAFRDVVKHSVAAGNSVASVSSEIKGLIKTLESLKKNADRANVSPSVIGTAQNILSAFTPDRIERVGNVSAIRDSLGVESSGTASLRLAIGRAFADIEKRVKATQEGAFQRATGNSRIGTGLYIDTETAFDPRLRQETGRLRNQLVEVTAQLFKFEKATGRVIEAQAGFYHGLQDLEHYSRSLRLPAGLSRDQLRGQAISPLALSQLIRRADFTVAHNAPFDRGVLQPYIPQLSSRPMLDSMRGVDWRSYGFQSRALQDLLRYNNIESSGAHRSTGDVQDAIRLLAARGPMGGQTYLGNLLGNQGPATNSQALMAVIASSAEQARAEIYARLGQSERSGRRVTYGRFFSALRPNSGTFDLPSNEAVAYQRIESVSEGIEARARKPARSTNYGTKFGSGYSEESTPGQLGWSALTLERRAGVLNELIRNMSAMTGPGASGEFLQVFSRQSRFQEGNQEYGGQRVRGKGDVRLGDQVFLDIAAGVNTQLRNRRTRDEGRSGLTVVPEGVNPYTFNVGGPGNSGDFDLMGATSRRTEGEQRVLAAVMRQAATERARKTVYLAGPMRGIPELNFPAFYRAEDLWRSAGWNTINPAQMDKDHGFIPTKTQTVFENLSIEQAMARDLPAVASAHAIALMPGWEKSQGANLELGHARSRGLEVYNAENFANMGGAGQAGRHPEELARIAAALGPSHPMYESLMDQILQSQADVRAGRRSQGRSLAGLGSSARPPVPGYSVLSRLSLAAGSTPSEEPVGFASRNTYRNLMRSIGGGPVPTSQEQRQIAEGIRQAQEQEQARMAEEVRSQQPDTSDLSAAEGRFHRFSAYPRRGPAANDPRRGSSGEMFSDLYNSIGRGFASARETLGSIFGGFGGSGSSGASQAQQPLADFAAQLRQLKRDDAIARLYRSADAAARALDEYGRNIAPQKAAKIQSDLQAKQEKIGAQLQDQLSTNYRQQQAVRQRAASGISRVDQRGADATGRFEDRRSRLFLNELFADDRYSSASASADAREPALRAALAKRKLTPAQIDSVVADKLEAPLRQLGIKKVLATYTREAFDASTIDERVAAHTQATGALFDLLGGSNLQGEEATGFRRRVEAALPTGRGGRVDLGTTMASLSGIRAGISDAEARRLRELEESRQGLGTEAGRRSAAAERIAAERRATGVGIGEGLQDEAARRRAEAEAAEARLRERFNLEDAARGQGGSRGGGGGSGTGGGLGGYSARNGLDFGIGLASLAAYSTALKTVLFDTVQYAARTEQLNAVTGRLAQTNYLNVDAVQAYVGAVKQQNITTQEAHNVVQRLMIGQLDVSKAPQLAMIARNLSTVTGLDPSSTLNNILTGVTTGQTRILHQAGLQVSALTVNRELRAQLGRDPTEFEKREGLLQAVTVEGGKSFGAFEVSLTTAAGQLALLSQKIAETKNAVGAQFIPAYNNVLQLTASGLKFIQEHPEASAKVGTGALSLGAAASVGGTLAFGGWAARSILGNGIMAAAGERSLGSIISSIGPRFAGFGAEAAEGGGLLAGIAGLGSGAIIPAVALAAGVGTYALLNRDPDKDLKQNAIKQTEDLKAQIEEIKKLRSEARTPTRLADIGSNTEEYYNNQIESGGQRILEVQQSVTARLAEEYGKQLNDWRTHVKDFSGDNGLWADIWARISSFQGISLSRSGVNVVPPKPQARGIPELGLTAKQVEATQAQMEKDQREQLALDPKVAKSLRDRATAIGLIDQVSEQGDKLEEGFEPGGRFNLQLQRKVDTPRTRIADASADFRFKLKNVADARKVLTDQLAARGKDASDPETLRLKQKIKDADKAVATQQSLIDSQDKVDAAEYAKLQAQVDAKVTSDLEAVSLARIHPIVGDYRSEALALDERRRQQLRFASQRFGLLGDPDKNAEELSAIQRDYDISDEEQRFKRSEEAREFRNYKVTSLASARAREILLAPGAGGNAGALRLASREEEYALRTTLPGTSTEGALAKALFENKQKLQADLNEAERDTARTGAEATIARQKNAYDRQNTVQQALAGRGGKSEGQQALEAIETRRQQALGLAGLTYDQNSALGGSNLNKLRIERSLQEDEANTQARAQTVVEFQRQVDARRREVGQGYQEAAAKTTRIAELGATNPAQLESAEAHAYQVKLDYIDREFAARDKNIDEEKAKRKQVLDAEYSEVERVLELRQKRAEEARSFAGGLFENLPFNTPVPGAIPHYLRTFALGQAKQLFVNATQEPLEGVFKNATKAFPGQFNKDGTPTELGKILGGSVFAKHPDSKVDVDKISGKIDAENLAAEKDLKTANENLTTAVNSLDNAIRSLGGLPPGAGGGTGGSGGGGGISAGGDAGVHNVVPASGSSASQALGTLGTLFPAAAASVNLAQKALAVPGVAKALNSAGLGGLFSSAGGGGSVGAGRYPDDVGGATHAGPRVLIDRTGSAAPGTPNNPLVVMPGNGAGGVSSPALGGIFAQPTAGGDAGVPGGGGGYSSMGSMPSLNMQGQLAGGAAPVDASGNYANPRYGSPAGSSPGSDTSSALQPGQRTSAVQTALSSFSKSLGGTGGVQGLQAGDTGAAAVGDVLGIAATEVGGTLQAVQGFKKGGAKGVIGGLAGVATDLSIIPGIGPFAAMAAGALDLVNAFIVDPKAKREADIQQYMQLQQYQKPVTLDATVGTGGTIVQQGLYGGAMATGINAFPFNISANQQIQAYKPYGTIDTQYIDIAGRVNGPGSPTALAGPYGGAGYIPPSNVSSPAPSAGAVVNVNLPISAMDSTDVLRRSPDIAAAVSKELKIGGGSGDLGYYINQSVFGAG